MTKVTKAAMPKHNRCGGGREEVRLDGWAKRVELPRTISPDNHVLRYEVLHRKAKIIKLDRTMISGKLTYRDKIFNKVRRN